ncbi:hypothetical protein AB4090_14095 [Acidithiobacillus sp. IBUN Pt1247-S3]|uniref:hypothetical protein n=1 Tax=Acidithiobacillus sp. IBUN Pt1247-S3 TaxID=3166642 RepID=UPI0034E3933D
MNQVLRNGKPYGLLRTVIPLRMHLYCQALAFVQGLSHRAMLGQCAQDFVKARPWERGLRWRSSPDPDQVSDLEWAQVAVPLPRRLASDLMKIGDQQGVPMDSVLYSMLFWYAWEVYPPLYERVRRRDEGAVCQK